MNAKNMQAFDADIQGLMEIFSKSLYSDRDVFLRELISNSSDAIFKLRLKSLESGSIKSGEGEINISIKDNWLEIADNGIGMNEQELTNICTIARSGTQSFLRSMDEKEQKESSLIGKFGVGFYSVFMVADKVEVITKSAIGGDALAWESDGSGYSIKSSDRTDFGTTVRLHLKDEAKEFADFNKIEDVIKNYSGHMQVPVVLHKPEEEPKIISSKQVIWDRAKVSDEEHKEFYKSLTHDFADPLFWVHQRIESAATDFKMLLYIPSQAPFDLYMKDRLNAVRLYVKRVFIMADPDKLLPSYLRFVRGVVDCQDLPLNVSRELLQNERQLSAIRSACVKRVLKKLVKIARDDADTYAKFWQNFGAVLKEGPTEDPANAEQLYELFRFASTHNSGSEQNVTLDDYIERYQGEDKKIYYIIADSYNSAKASPHLEYFASKNTEVLLLSDKVDEWLMSQMTEYKGFKLQSILQSDFDKNAEAEQESEQEESEYKDVFARIEELLSSEVKSVRSTTRLVSSPCCLVTDSNEMSQNLKRLLEQAGQAVPDSKPILELNVEHPLVKSMLNEQAEDAFKDWAYLLFDQAQLLEGAALKKPSEFVHRLNRLLGPLLD